MVLASDDAQKYKVIWTDRALDDVWNIGCEIYEYSGWEPSVNKWVKLIIDAGDGLFMFPERNSNKVTVKGRTIWHINVKRRFVIYYEIDKCRSIITIHKVASNKASSAF